MVHVLLERDIELLDGLARVVTLFEALLNLEQVDHHLSLTGHGLGDEHFDFLVYV